MFSLVLMPQAAGVKGLRALGSEVYQEMSFIPHGKAGFYVLDTLNFPGKQVPGKFHNVFCLAHYRELFTNLENLTADNIAPCGIRAATECTFHTLLLILFFSFPGTLQGSDSSSRSEAGAEVRIPQRPPGKAEVAGSQGGHP